MSRDHNSDFISDVKPLLSNCMCRFSDLPSGVANAASISLAKSVDFPLLGLNLYGKSTQGYASHGGTPLGKNLFDVYDIFDPASGIILERPATNTVKVYNTVDMQYAATGSPFYTYKAGVTYTVSFVVDAITLGNVSVALRNRDNVIKAHRKPETTGKYSFSFTPTEDVEYYFSILTTGSTATTGSVTLSNIQIEIGATATDYEPYYSAPNPSCPVPIENVGDDGEVKVQCCGKNLLVFPYSDGDAGTIKTTNGMTFTVLSDGGVTVNGTATNDAFFQTFFKQALSKGSYVVTGATETAWLRVGLGKDNALLNHDRGQGCSFDLTESTVVSISIRVFSGYTVDNQTIYPMLRLASETDDTYEPYSGTTATLTSALPLCGLPVQSGGNYTDSNGQQWVCDELIYNADGTGKVVKRTGLATFDGSEDENWLVYASATNKKYYVTYSLADIYKDGVSVGSAPSYLWCDRYPVRPSGETYNDNEGISASRKAGYIGIYDANYVTGNLSEFISCLASNPVTVIYQKNNPEEINLTAEEMAQLYQLYSYNGTTNIFNDEGAEMSISACTNPVLAAEALPIIKRLEAQAAVSQTATTENT